MTLQWPCIALPNQPTAQLPPKPPLQQSQSTIDTHLFSGSKRSGPWKKPTTLPHPTTRSQIANFATWDKSTATILTFLVDDSCRLPWSPLLESLWRVYFLGACPWNDKRYCNQLANYLTNVWKGCKIETCPIHWFPFTYLNGHAACNAISILSSVLSCCRPFLQLRKNKLVREQNRLKGRKLDWHCNDPALHCQTNQLPNCLQNLPYSSPSPP